MRRALPISESTCRRSSILPTAPSAASCEHFTQGSCLDREKEENMFSIFSQHDIPTHYDSGGMMAGVVDVADRQEE